MLHELDSAIIWHGRLMVLGWAILLPAGVVIARYFKILPGQQWPRKLDNLTWWYSHLVCQYAGTLVTALAIYLVMTLGLPSDGVGFETIQGVHRIAGWTTIVLLFVQVGFGVLRGTKGGPTEIAKTGTERGDHYDMTPRRRMFESVHKSTGYLALVVAQITILLGLKVAAAPLWMTLTLLLWWLVLIGLFLYLQKHHFYVDSYQAIWGSSKPGGSKHDNLQHHPWIVTDTRRKNN